MGIGHKERNFTKYLEKHFDIKLPSDVEIFYTKGVRIGNKKLRKSSIHGDLGYAACDFGFNPTNSLIQNFGHLAKKNIVLEVCPTSNLRVKFVKDLKDMKRILHKFMKYDVKFTINSDNPQLLQTNVSNEMDLLYKNGILNKQQIEQCLKNSVEASFIRL